MSGLGRSILIAFLFVGCIAPAIPARAQNEHVVNVTDAGFIPAEIDVQVGDSVFWLKGGTTEPHGLVSCTASQPGCGGETATESFGTGVAIDPSIGFNFHFIFGVEGYNPYVCPAHPLDEWGAVYVHGAGPPPVPDGAPGTQLFVAPVPGFPDRLRLEWDVDTCYGAVQHHVVTGFGSGLPVAPGGTYSLLPETTSSCGLGGPLATIAGVADPAVDPTRFLWILVIADDGEGTEGSWGTDSAGNERGGVGAGGASDQCLSVAKTTTNSCTR